LAFASQLPTYRITKFSRTQARATSEYARQARHRF
jgi:hypothetical protein